MGEDGFKISEPDSSEECTVEEDLLCSIDCLFMRI